MATGRQVTEAAAGSMLGRRWLTPPARKVGRGKGRGKRGGDLTGFWLGLSAVIVVGLLVVFRPALPSWLPGPVLNALGAVERLHGL